MSSSASGQEFHPPADWEDFTDDQKDKPPPYTQEPIFEGSYIEEECVPTSRRNYDDAGYSGSVEDGYTNPAYQTPPRDYPQQPQYPQGPENSAYLHQFQEGQHPSHYIAPFQPYHGAYGPAPNYTSLQDVTHPPTATGKSIVTRPQVYSGQPTIVAVQPLPENPIDDYMCYSTFVALCCCWFLGIRALRRSRECRTALEVGHMVLAKQKSDEARVTAHCAVVFGIFMYIIIGVIFGVYFGKLKM